MFKKIKYIDPAVLQRKRINENPSLALAVLRQMKQEDTFGWGVTRQELAERLLSLALASRVH